MLTYTTAAAAREDYFTDQSWFLEPGYMDGFDPATRAFFQRFVDRFAPFWEREVK